MKRLLLLLAAVLAGLIGLGFIMPALAKWRADGISAGWVLGPLVLGGLLLLGGLFIAVTALVRRRA